METVLCPHCGKEVELSSALRHDVEEKITKELRASQEVEISKIKKEVEETAEKKFKEQNSFKEKDLLAQVEELQKVKKEADAKELELLKKEREMDDKSRRIELDLQRKLNDEVDRVRKEDDQKAKLEKMEVEKKLADTQKALDELQQKAKQGSQQLQGEVLELDLENQLRLSFPDDEILPVPKGVSGGDVLQKVCNKQGKTAGIIIWEAKRAKWNETWTQKLKDDMISANANEAILVVEELPEKISNSGFIKGIWITSYKDALTIADSIRILLMKLAQSKAAEENKDEKLEDLYQFINGDNFKHRISSHLETVRKMQQGLESDKRLQERTWKRREVEISRLNRLTGVFDEIAAISEIDLPLLPPETPISVDTDSDQEELNLMN